MIIHYYRYSGDYEGWNVWAWPVDPPGEAGVFVFNPDKPDADGFVTARVFFNIPAAAKEIGMIIRRSEADNDWAEKDGQNDRFTKEKEVWLIRNDPAVYTERPQIKNPPIMFAAADSPFAVIAALPKEPKDDGVFSVYEGDRKLKGVSRKAAEDNEPGDAKDGVYKIIISLDEKIADPSKLYMVRDESGAFSERKVVMRRILDNFYYDGNDLGLRYISSHSVFNVWAPTAKTVSVALYDYAGEYNPAGKAAAQETKNLYPMEKYSETGVWSALVKGDLEGKFYLYRVEFADGTVTWASDPYAKAVSANGQRAAIVDPAKTNPEGWQPGKKPPFKAGAWQDAVIYELHVRDFSIDENSGMKHKGKFLAFTERGTLNADGISTGTDHLVRLGVTHVHLLPAFDFASVNELVVDDPASVEPKFNWGYDPMHYNVPEGSYSTDPKNPGVRIKEFKQMVQALHEAGIRVIMDVVFNHTYQTGGWPFDALVPGYFYRITDNGVYANGSGCGNETASERPMVRKFIIDSCRYWAQEYGIDGFRFDLMGLIDTPTMKKLTEELRRIDPTIIIYGEPWTGGKSALSAELQTGAGAQKGLGFAVFNDHLRWAIKGGSDDASRGFASGMDSTEEGIVRGLMGSINDFTSQANESINYVTAHDNLNLWDKFALSHGAKDLAGSPYKPLKSKKSIFEADAVMSSVLANGIILTSQGIPFFQAGDEFLRSKFGDSNSYSSGDGINKIRWENAGLYREAVDYYAGLIRLRREHPAFRQSSVSDIEKSLEILEQHDMGVSWTLKNNAGGDIWRTIFVAYNGSDKPRKFSLPQISRVWYQVVDSRQAGTKTLAEHSGSITLPRLSMAVLHD